MGHGGRDRRLLESVGRAGALGVLLVALVAWWLAWAGSSAAATIRYGDSRVAAAASMSGPVGPLVAYAFSEGSGHDDGGRLG